MTFEFTQQHLLTMVTWIGVGFATGTALLCLRGLYRKVKAAGRLQEVVGWVVVCAAICCSGVGIANWSRWYSASGVARIELSVWSTEAEKQKVQLRELIEAQEAKVAAARDSLCPLWVSLPMTLFGLPLLLVGVRIIHGQPL